MPFAIAADPAVVTVDGLTIETARRLLIDGASFSLADGQHVALVGRNGSGKTTLFETLAARFARRPRPAHVSVSGRIVTRPGARCGYLAQHPARGESAVTVRRHLDRNSGEAASVHARYQELSADSDRLSENLDEYGALIDRLSDIGGWDVEPIRNRLLDGIGLSAAVQSRRLSTLSGGEASKVAMAGLLLAEPDLLLLDEPTNNLDPHSVTFLSEWIRGSPAAVLVVSHDRDFLDDVAGSVLEIDEETSRVELYGGNYSFYSRLSRDRHEARVRAFEEQQAKRLTLLESAGALSSSASRFQAQSRNDFYRAKGRKVARRATVQRARVERQLSALPEPQPPRRPRIEVAAVPPGDGIIVQAHDVSIAFAGRAPLVEGLCLAIHRGERVAIVGANGTGKTTLLRVLIGELAATAGWVERDLSMTLGYLPQSVADPSASASVVDHARRLANISEDRARELINKVVFGDVGDLPMASFSAGERRRIELAVSFAAAPWLLVLDEPTNHLDLATIEMLEEALDEYAGAVLTVSHDRRFLERAGIDRVVALEGDGSA